jgi:hypothetical protein
MTSPPGLTAIRERRFGETTLTFFADDRSSP